MSPQQVLMPSSDSEGAPSTSPSPLPSSMPPSPPPLQLLRALDERQLCYLLVISLRHFSAIVLTSPPSRALAFSNSLRLGICFTPLKERFIREGDLSDQVVHSWFIWFMAVMGVHLYQESRHQWAQLRLQSTLSQTLLKMVLQMQGNVPPFDMFQALYLMAMSCTYTHTLVPARRYLVRCQDMIQTEGYRLADPTWIDASSRTSPSAVIDDRPSEYTEEKHEMVSILVNLMYLQCIHCMLYGECRGLYADLEAQLPDFAVRSPLWLCFRGVWLKYRLLAGLSRGLGTLLDRAQGPYCPFGSGCILAYRAARGTGSVRFRSSVVISTYR